jgi:hypothetical protein
MGPGRLREGQGTEQDAEENDARGQRFKKPSRTRC